jgi:CHAT domain-containing protein/Tfp pilus assembly protein PilF
MPSVRDCSFPVFSFVIRTIWVLLLLLVFPEETMCLSWRGVATLSGSSVSAEEAFAEAERLRKEWKEQSLRAAIEKYQQALAYWRTENNIQKQAEILGSIGEVFAVFGQTASALANYEDALRLSRRLNDTSLQIESLNNVCSVLAFLGETKKALTHCNEALRLSRRTGNRAGEAEALNNIGEANYFADMNKALKSFEQALLLRADRRGEAHTLMNIGYVYTDWNDLQQASNYFARAVTIWKQIGDLSGEARTVNALGVLHGKLSEKQKALAEHTRARELFSTIGNRPGELTALTGIGNVYDSMGEKDKALDRYREALNISREVGQREAELVLLVHVGNIHQALERQNEALQDYRQALKLSRVLDDERMQAYSLRFIGEIYESYNRLPAALRYYEQALSLSRPSNDTRGEAAVLNDIGSIRERNGETKSALNHYNRALTLQLAAKDRQGEAWTRYNMAKLHRDHSDLELAKSQIATSVDIIDSVRTNVGSHELRLSYFASVQQYYELYIDILMQLHKARPADGFDVVAFEVSGRARARNLLDLLVESSFDLYQSIDPVLGEKERNLRQALNAKSEREVRLLSVKHSEAEAVQLKTEIGKLSFELEDVRAQIRDQNPRYAALIDPPTLSVGNVQELLDDDTVLLQYALGEKHSYLWAVTNAQINTYELPDRVTIEQCARDLYRSLSTRNDDETDEEPRQQALELGRMILDPAMPQLRTKRLLVVADGALLLVPFGALATSTGASPEVAPLMVAHEIVNLPSTSTLAILRKITARRQVAPKVVAVLADPILDANDPRLPPPATGSPRPIEASEVEDPTLIDTGTRIARLLASREEADDIVRMAPRGSSRKLMGFAANLDAVKDPHISQYRILHFATHGIFNNEHPELSGIVLSLYDADGRRRAGFLGLHEIYNLNLPVELVVLSACNTARGREVRGEGLIGLTRGFMYAGVSRVLSSLWKVDEDATAELMKHFYEGVLVERLPPAAALRQAQIKMWQTKRWRSPYYWAAFVLQGEHRSSPLVPAEDPERRYAIAAGTILLALIGLYLLTRTVGVTR